MKEYKRTLIVTSIVTLCPMAIGLLMWNRMPDVVAIHFGSDNVPNGWSSKGFAVFGLPLFLLGIQLLCSFATLLDPKKENIDKKHVRRILWFVPILSLVCCSAIYAAAVGKKVDIETIVYLLVGITFIIIGNYMHKLKQNYTIGIKLPWTLASEENWNRTHRLASWLWVLGGFFCIAGIFVPIGKILIGLILLMAGVPVIYSVLLYRKGI